MSRSTGSVYAPPNRRTSRDIKRAQEAFEKQLDALEKAANQPNVDKCSIFTPRKQRELRRDACYSKYGLDRLVEWLTEKMGLVEDQLIPDLKPATAT